MKTPKAAPKPVSQKPYHHGDLATELLAAAEAELAENGIEAFSLRAVAKRAGVSHGAPAHHFGDAKGLLTALAAIGYERLVASQNARQAAAKSNPTAQRIAAGLGYIDFAIAHPALFRLMFSSEKPDRTEPRFAEVSVAAFDKLVAEVQQYVGADPYTDTAAMLDVMASWSMVHGLADLIISGRADRAMGFNKMSPAARDKALSDLISRTIKPEAVR